MFEAKSLPLKAPAPSRPSVPAPKIAIINRSSVVADATAAHWTAAMQVQCDRDFAAHWFTSADLTFVGRNQAPPPAHWWILILDDADMAGALGYHDVTPADNPLGKVFARTTMQDGGQVSVTLSHELLEMLGDPDCVRTATVSTQSGSTTYALEVADACEDDSYSYAINGVLVSDFVTRGWFDPLSHGPYDHQGHISRPFEILKGGYIALLQSNGQWTQQTADGEPHHSANDSHRGNRFHRRAAGRAAHKTVDGHAHRLDLGVRKTA